MRPILGLTIRRHTSLAAKVSNLRILPRALRMALSVLDASKQDLGEAVGTPLDWTTNDPSVGNAVVRQGFGFLKENQDANLGPNYWMLDVDMDCGMAMEISGVHWFEVKSFITNVPNGWEPDVAQPGAPWVSGNHFAQCGKINIFERGSNAATFLDFDPVNECSFPGTERRCDGSMTQVCGTSGTGAKVWQTAQNCVQNQQLCQPTTGMCSGQSGERVGDKEVKF